MWIEYLKIDTTRLPPRNVVILVRAVLYAVAESSARDTRVETLIIV